MFCAQQPSSLAVFDQFLDIMLVCPNASCGRSFSKQCNLQRHVETRHNQTERRSVCPACKLPMKDLARHRKRCKEDSSSQRMAIFACPFCDDKFATFDLFEGHMFQVPRIFLRCRPCHLWSLTKDRTILSIRSKRSTNSPIRVILNHGWTSCRTPSTSSKVQM